MIHTRAIAVVLFALGVATSAQAQIDTTRSAKQLQVRQRATREGLKWGAVSGTIGGAAFGALVGYVAYAMCDSGVCPDNEGKSIAIGTLGGATGGLVAGGVLGAVLGSAIPKWVKADRARTPAPERIGTLRVAPLVARAQGGGTGIGTRAEFAFQTRHLTLGPELAWQSIGTNARPVYVPCTLGGVCIDTVSLHESVLQLGGNARLGLGSDRRVEPYATVGTGFYVWSRGASQGSTGLAGYSVGGGVQLRDAARRHSLFAEARWQSNLSRSSDPNPDYGFSTFAIGAATAW